LVAGGVYKTQYLLKSAAIALVRLLYVTETAQVGEKSYTDGKVEVQEIGDRVLGQQSSGPISGLCACIA
jgi:hypothetical protein